MSYESGLERARMRVSARSRFEGLGWALLAVLVLSAISAPCRASQTEIAYSVAIRGAAQHEYTSFVRTVASVYADPRGWSLGGRVRFVHVTSAGAFTIWLAAASEMSSFSTQCVTQWSCRVGRDVVINETRWTSGSLYWQGDLNAYRTMLINHETGHFLGLEHASCSGAGTLAPVMMQQSKGTAPCRPNAWPLASERELAAHALGL
jgi:hypothetical protein